MAPVQPLSGWPNAAPTKPNMVQKTGAPEFTHDDTNEKNSPGNVVGSNMAPIQPVSGWANAPPTKPHMAQKNVKDISFGAHQYGDKRWEQEEHKSLAQTAVIAQDKVKEMASKLRIPLTPDLLQLGSNEKISSALIDKAVAAGRSEKEINSAMEKM